MATRDRVEISASSTTTKCASLRDCKTQVRVWMRTSVSMTVCERMRGRERERMDWEKLVWYVCSSFERSCYFSKFYTSRVIFRIRPKDPSTIEERPVCRLTLNNIMNIEHSRQAKSDMQLKSVIAFNPLFLKKIPLLVGNFKFIIATDFFPVVLIWILLGQRN